jgi:aspartate/methionine/tyrosine aminotransferase
MYNADRLARLPLVPTFEARQRVREARARGVAVIGLEMGDPDLPTPPHVVDALARALADPASSLAFSLRLLDVTGVSVTPGIGYGSRGEGFVRLSLTVPDELLAAAMARVAASWDRIIGPTTPPPAPQAAQPDQRQDASRPRAPRAASR